MSNADAQPANPLIEYLAPRLLPGERPYVVVDGARALDVVHAARDSYGLQILSLFEQPGATRLADVAPYLVIAEPSSGFLDLWAERLGSCTGILVVTAICVRELRGHLRRLFVATDEDEEEYFFRFYDPRVLRAFLPTCSGQQAREFFGPIRRVLVETERPGRIVDYSLDHAGLESAETALPAFRVPSTARVAPASRR